MRQALHIFAKDVRYLRWEIAVVLMLEILLGWTGRSNDPWLEETLFLLAACFLIARVVHAEAIPGHNQFWITRPYRWQSLAAAKIVFILLFINVPMMAIQLFGARVSGFALATILAGLLWSQVLMIACITLPVGALATMTPGLASFLLVALVSIAAVALASGTDLVMLFFRHPPRHPADPPAAIEWVRNSLPAAGSALVAILVWYTQYRYRRSDFSRVLSLCAVAFIASLYFSFPWTLAWNVQSVFSKNNFDEHSLRLALDPAGKGKFPMPGREKLSGVQLLLPLALSGIPAEMEAQADAISISLESASGQVWRTELAGVNRQVAPSGITFFHTYLIADPLFFQAVSGKPATVRAKLYLTLFGNPHRQEIPMQPKYVSTLAGLRCGTGAFGQLYCRSAFRWPARRVYAQFGQTRQELFTSAVSYSPFPAELRFNPLESRWVSRPESDPNVTIFTTEPVTHLTHEFTLEGAYLENYTGS